MHMHLQNCRETRLQKSNLTILGGLLALGAVLISRACY